MDQFNFKIILPGTFLPMSEPYTYHKNSSDNLQTVTSHFTKEPWLPNNKIKFTYCWVSELFKGHIRVAEVARAREQRSPKGQGLLRKEGPPTYAIVSRNLVLSRFTRFLKGFHRAFNESHPAFLELSTKAILLS